MWSSYWLPCQKSAQVCLFSLLPPRPPPQTGVISPPSNLSFLCFFTCHSTLLFLLNRALGILLCVSVLSLKEISTRNQLIWVFFFCVLEHSGQNCSHPIIPEHGGFYCKPSPCRGFPPKSRIYYFCESGYVLPNRVHHSNCRKGRWEPSIPTCVPNSGKTDWLHLWF